VGYLHVASGSVACSGMSLAQGDALECGGHDTADVVAREQSILLWFDLPAP